MKWANVSCKGPGGTPGFFFQMLLRPLSASNFIKKKLLKITAHYFVCLEHQLHNLPY